MKKRIISFIMVLSVLCSMVVDSSLVYAADAPVVYTQADFDDLELVGETGAESYAGATGQAPYLFWGKKGQMKEAVAPGGKAVGTSFTDLGAEDRALQWIIDDNASEDVQDKVNVYMDISFPVSADVYGQREIAFSANLYYESYSGQGYLNCDLRNSYSKASENLFRIMSNGEIRGFRNDPDAKNNEGIGVTAYRPGKGQWFQIKAVINTKTLTYDFYLDGVKKNRESLPLVNPEMRFYGDPEEDQNSNTITTIRLQMYDNADSIDQGVIYIDDIYVGEHVKNWDEPAEGPVFPAAADYPDGIAGVDESGFKDRELYRPLNTGFELLEETDAVAKNNANNQLAIVEDRHSGRFALKLLQNADEILPIKESDSFRITDIPTAVARARAADNSYLPEVGQHEYKQNVVNIWVKPLYKAEELTFYTWMDVTDNGTIDEALVPIKSDKDGDGIYKLGEDFTQGKWQQIRVDLTKTESASIDGCAKGLYVKANIDSEWIFDDLTCDYLETHETEMDLNGFVNGNVINTEGGLQFSKNNGVFDAADQVVQSKLDINEKIVGINVDSTVEHLGTTAVEVEPPEDMPWIDIPIEDEQWTINDANYDTQTENVSKKVPATKWRKELPEIAGGAKSLKIPFDSETEQRFRLIYRRGFDADFTFTDADGIETSPGYTSGVDLISDWFTSAITVNSYSAFSKNEFEIKGIEYEPVVEEEEDILIKPGGTAALQLDSISTDNRVKAVLDITFLDKLPAADQKIMLSVYGQENQKLYETYGALERTLIGQQIIFILPKLEQVSKIELKNLSEVGDNGSGIVRVSGLAINPLASVDWNFEYSNINRSKSVTYMNKVPSAAANAEVKKLSELYNIPEHYAVEHMYAYGLVSTETAQATLTVDAGEVVRFVNLNTEPVSVKMGTKDIWLNYGECDVLAEDTTITLPATDKKVAVLYVASYGDEFENKNNIPYYFVDGLNTTPIMSEDGTVLYYLNKYDQSKLYAYDVNTGESTKCTDAIFGSLVDVKSKRYVLADRGSDRLLYDLQEGTETICPEEYSKQPEYLSAQGDVLYVSDSDGIMYLYQAQNGDFLKIYESDRYTSSGSFYDPELALDASGNNMALYYKFSNNSPEIVLFKRTDGVWAQTKTITLSDEASDFKFSNDANKLYFNRESKIYELDLKTDAEKELQEGSISMVCGDGRLLYMDADETYYYLYNPVNGERQRITQYSIVSGTDVWYSPDYNQIIYIAPNNMLARYILGSDKPLERYLLSFDGCASWYAFRGGRWLLASQSLKPSTEELSLNGMTAEELNAIKPVDFEKLYQNDTEIVTLHVAIYMNSNSNKVSPAISNITVQTAANQVEERLAAASYQGYNKADYRKINAIFPIENFRKPAECYYILTLGNDWLYTYKEGKLVHLPLGADEIAEDVTQNWIEIKQYGMTASELRNIPEEALNDLLLNENYANTAFGIIYVVRPDDYSTESYTVDFRIQADAQYFNYEELVMEITVNGVSMTFTTPDDLSVDAVDQFMSWLSGRQNGKGDIFYQLQTSGGQYFINYFMISNVNVYNKATYNPIVPSVFSEIADEQEEDTEPEVSDSADPSELE